MRLSGELKEQKAKRENENDEKRKEIETVCLGPAVGKEEDDRQPAGRQTLRHSG